MAYKQKPKALKSLLSSTITLKNVLKKTTDKSENDLENFKTYHGIRVALDFNYLETKKRVWLGLCSGAAFKRNWQALIKKCKSEKKSTADIISWEEISKLDRELIQSIHSNTDFSLSDFYTITGFLSEKFQKKPSKKGTGARFGWHKNEI